MSLCSCRYDRWLKLSECANKLGIVTEEANLHTAKYDNNLNIEVYNRLSRNLRAA